MPVPPNPEPNPAALRSELSLAGDELVLTVLNGSGAPVSFCVYHTPFEGIRNDIFEVTGPDGELEYRGMMLKRRAPGPQDYLKVEPGASLTARIGLSALREAYPGPDHRSVRFRGTDGLPPSQPLTFGLTR